MKKLLLAGNATTAEIIASYLAKDHRYEVVATVVDDKYLSLGNINGIANISISQVTSAFPPDSEVSFMMAMGYDDLNRTRQSFFDKVKELGYSIETYVHPDAKIYTQYPLGEGCIVLPNSVVEPFVQVGLNTIIWSNVTLAHHSIIDKNCWIASGAVISGRAMVKRNTFVGVNATIVNETVVSEYNIIGGNAFVTKNTKAHEVYLARSAEKWRFTSEMYMKYLATHNE